MGAKTKRTIGSKAFSLAITGLYLSYIFIEEVNDAVGAYYQSAQDFAPIAFPLLNLAFFTLIIVYGYVEFKKYKLEGLIYFVGIPLLVLVAIGVFKDISNAL